MTADIETYLQSEQAVADVAKLLAMPGRRLQDANRVGAWERQTTSAWTKVGIDYEDSGAVVYFRYLIHIRVKNTEYKRADMNYYWKGDVQKVDPAAVIVTAADVTQTGGSYFVKGQKKAPKEIYLENNYDDVSR